MPYMNFLLSTDFFVQNIRSRLRIHYHIPNSKLAESYLILAGIFLNTGRIKMNQPIQTAHENPPIPAAVK